MAIIELGLAALALATLMACGLMLLSRVIPGSALRSQASVAPTRHAVKRAMDKFRTGEDHSQTPDAPVIINVRWFLAK